MSWGDAWKIVLALIASMGGIGTVVIVVVKFVGNHIAEKLACKYEFRLNKELEAFKGAVDKKLYVSKTRFDAEFSIYRELSKSFFEMVKDCSFVFHRMSMGPVGEEERKEYDKNYYKAFVKSTTIAEGVLYQNAPFISEELYKEFELILCLCNQQILNCGARLQDNYNPPPEDRVRFDNSDYDRTEDIISKQEALSRKNRTYLSKLDVLD